MGVSFPANQGQKAAALTPCPLEGGSVGFQKAYEVAEMHFNLMAVKTILANSLLPLEASANPSKTINSYPRPREASSGVPTTDM